MDYARGSLMQSDADGTWDTSVGNLCIYTFKENQVIWARSSLFVQLSVINPASWLQRTAPENVTESARACTCYSS